MELSSFSVSGYKSIEDHQEIKLEDLNILIGENNTGKSSVLDALQDYREIFPDATQIQSEWAHSRNTGKHPTGYITFSTEIRLDPKEHETFIDAIKDKGNVGDRKAERWKDSGYFREIHHEIEIVSDPDPTEPVACVNEMTANFGHDDFEGDEVHLLKGDPSGTEYLKFQSLPAEEAEFTSKKLAWTGVKEVIEESMKGWTFVDSFRNPEAILPAQREIDLVGEGRNLTQVLLTLSGEPDDRFEKISNTYADVMAGVEGIRAKLPEGDQTTVVVDEEKYDAGFDLSEISAGSKEILTLITQIVLAKEDTDLLAIEEPEIHLHPGAERELLDRIKKELIGDGPQVVISTHSSVFVSHLEVDTIYRVKRETSSELSEVDHSEIGADLRELGYEYAGMFQSEAVVIVEGLTDRVALKGLGKKYGLDFDERNIGVIEMGNSSKLVNHARSLVKLFCAFGIPFLFICDSDLDTELKNEDDEVPETPLEIQGRLIETVNGTGDDGEEPNRVGWDKIGPDDIHVWQREELEAYLLENEAKVAEAFTRLDEEKVGEVLVESEEMDPEEKLERLCAEARPELDGAGDVSPMEKKTDVSEIVGALDSEDLPDEFVRVLERIGDLVDAEQIVSDSSPDSYQ